MCFSLSFPTGAHLSVSDASERFLRDGEDDDDEVEDAPEETVGRDDTGMAGENTDDKTGIRDIKGNPQT